MKWIEVDEDFPETDLWIDVWDTTYGRVTDVMRGPDCLVLEAQTWLEDKE